MSNSARKARKRAGIAFEHPTKTPTPKSAREPKADRDRARGMTPAREIASVRAAVALAPVVWPMVAAGRTFPAANRRQTQGAET